MEFRRKVADFEEFSLRARYARVISAALRQEEASSAVRAPRSLGSWGPWRLILAPRGANVKGTVTRKATLRVTGLLISTKCLPN